jgi:uncharacterized membrane protein YbhN (UPF0104 family)
MFSFAFVILTVLPLAIEKFVRASDRTYKGVSEMIKAFGQKAEKDDKRVYFALIVLSLVSFSLFMIGCFLALSIVPKI